MENKNVPAQQKGNQFDTEHSVTASSDEDAKRIFAMAAERLLDVNCWDKLSGPTTATFRLTDADGHEVGRPAQRGDHFKIDIPGPGPATGDGFDWVEVEVFDDKRNASPDQESVTLRVRPTPSPLNAEKDTAHFFNEEATSSFVVQRRGNVVTAEIHGRNETPNAEVDKTKDKVRNSLVGMGAITAFSAPQWNSLVKGLLDPTIQTDKR